MAHRSCASNSPSGLLVVWFAMNWSYVRGVSHCSQHGVKFKGVEDIAISSLDSIVADVGDWLRENNEPKSQYIDHSCSQQGGEMLFSLFQCQFEVASGSIDKMWICDWVWCVILCYSSWSDRLLMMERSQIPRPYSYNVQYIYNEGVSFEGRYALHFVPL